VAAIRKRDFEMKLRFTKETPASEQMCLTLETALGCELSKQFRSFVQRRDGAVPETNVFRISENNESGVNGFIPVSQILQERTRLENIPAKAYPIAWAEGGNYIYIDEEKGGAVFFWDHERPREVARLAADFDAFLAILEPFDIKKIILRPRQVKKVWVDPEFLKRLNKD
jgi:hypothetical protein